MTPVAFWRLSEDQAWLQYVVRTQQLLGQAANEQPGIQYRPEQKAAFRGCRGAARREFVAEIEVDLAQALLGQRVRRDTQHLSRGPLPWIVQVVHELEHVRVRSDPKSAIFCDVETVRCAVDVDVFDGCQVAI